MRRGHPLFIYESMLQLVFVYPSRRITVVPLPNVWIHLTVGLGVTLQALTVVVPPLRKLLGLVPVSAAVFSTVMIAVLLTWAVAEFLGRRTPISSTSNSQRGGAQRSSSTAAGES